MTHFITTEIARHGYLAVFVLMVLESACIPVPSEAVLTFGGALAGGLLATGGHAQVGVVGIALAGTAGNLVGSLIAYAVGRAGGRALAERWGRYVMLRPSHVDRAEVFFARRGDLAVLVGRVLPVVRTFISLPAGVARMPVGRFSFYTTLGSLPWSFGLAYAGWALASNWDSVSHYFTPVSVAVVVIALGLGVRWYLHARRSPAATETPGDPPGEDASRGATLRR